MRVAVALVSTMASLQYSRPVQAMVWRRKTDGAASSPSSRRPCTQGVGAVRLDVEDEQLLVRGQPHPRRAVRLGGVGEPDQQLAGDAAHDGRGADVAAAVLLLVDADVVAAVLGGGRRRPVGQRRA